MPKYNAAGVPLNNLSYVKVAASQTTQNISTPHDEVVGRDYLDRVIVTWATTAGTGNTVDVLDGTTSLAIINTTTLQELVKVVEFNCFAQSTKGFQITSGASVSCIAVGRFGKFA
jgi:hypothetical protein